MKKYVVERTSKAGIMPENRVIKQNYWETLWENNEAVSNHIKGKNCHLPLTPSPRISLADVPYSTHTPAEEVYSSQSLLKGVGSETISREVDGASEKTSSRESKSVHFVISDTQ